MKLGRLAPRPGIVAPHLGAHMKLGMNIPKSSVDWIGSVKSWSPLGNLTTSDCTCAAAYHIAQAWRANSSKDEWQPTDQQALDLYGVITGYPKVDEGAVEIDILNHWAKIGISTDIGTETIAFAALEPTNLNEIKLAIQYFGAAYIGVNLPISAQTQSLWTISDGGAVGNGAPGTWGGHALPLLAYDETGFVTVTWGKVMRMTNDFLQAYCVEAYALISEDWLSDSGISPPGLNMASLRAEMASLSA